MGSRVETRRAERQHARDVQFYREHFLSVLHNIIRVPNLPKDTPKRYFLRVLFTDGQIGYYGKDVDGKNGVFLPASGVGVDLYGLPTQWNLTGFNGRVFVVPARDCVILRINDLSQGLMSYLQKQSEILAEFDSAIRQNLDAVRTMTVGTVPDQAALLSYENAAYSRHVGAMHIFVNKDNTLSQNFQSFSTGATYLVDKMISDRSKIFQQTLETLGIPSTVQKAERVQSSELATSNTYAYCNVKTMVDTFNYDAEMGGLDLRMEINDDLQSVYLNNLEKSQAEVINSEQQE